MNDRRRPVRKVYIHAGEIHVDREPAEIHTLLGSCVSVCLFDESARVGGMNHILLPGQPDLARQSGSTRYAVNAMEVLINNLLAAGASRSRIIAKVFGGANVLQALSQGRSPGLQNVEFVLRYLDIEGIPVRARDVGGDRARLLYFLTATGDVYVKKLPPFHRVLVYAEERIYLERVEREAEVAGEVTLFPPS